jgi:diguanylate cyclase (GGDEF)-like protein
MIIKSLRTEIATLALTSILCVSALVLWFAVNAYQSLYQQSSSNDLNGLSENLAVELIANVVEEDDFAIANTLLQLEQYENVRFAAVFNENGQVLSSYLGSALIRNKTPDEIIAMPKINFEVYYQFPLGMSKPEGSIVAKKRIGDAQSLLGYLIIENDLSGPLLRSKKDLLWSVLPWSIITILICVAVMFIFQQRALKPLVQLARFTQKIRDTKDYSLVSKVKGKSEISMVTAGLNSMMQEINSEVEKNKQKTDLLIEQQQQMEKLANFDVLTGLPNRQFFMQKLGVAVSKAKLNSSEVTLLFFDLDGFKVINDSFGHEIGDRLLCVVGDRITEIIGAKHEVARLGGDEFLVMLEGDLSDSFVLQTAQKFIEGISTPVDIEHWNVQVGTSIGIAKASVAGFVINELLANADIAMYRAKADGRNRYTMFTQDMIENSRRKLQIANALSNGIINDEFTLFYQPKVDTTGKIIGYEALTRWSNETLGFISPVEFIPIAEQSGKISQVTEWVIHQVCKDSRAIFAIKDDIKIALNLSVHDLKNQHLIAMIKDQIAKYNVNPQQLEFEITESAYLDNFSNANSIIEEIKMMGSSIALDDFGTGYSSLSYLTQINIDTLKIDKQFVDQIGVSERSTLITKTIIEMAKQLNLSVCAEGVETIEQGKLLVENGCHIMQGYYFGRPQPLNVILQKLATMYGVQQSTQSNSVTDTAS